MQQLWGKHENNRHNWNLFIWNNGPAPHQSSPNSSIASPVLSQHLPLPHKSSPNFSHCLTSPLQAQWHGPWPCCEYLSIAWPSCLVYVEAQIDQWPVSFQSATSYEWQKNTCYMWRHVYTHMISIKCLSPARLTYSAYQSSKFEISILSSTSWNSFPRTLLYATPP